MTRALYWEDAYCRQTRARAAAARTEDGNVFAALDATIFYPRGGGQPGDCGELRSADGAPLPVLDTVKDRETGAVWHLLQTDSPPPSGAELELRIDWTRRHGCMRAHTAMHLLCAAIHAPVTGGSMDALRGRIDFDCGALPDKAELEEKINGWITGNASVCARWTDEKELDDNPGLARAMSAPPPRGAGKVRLVEIAGIDLQACGGTHVAALGEIGKFQIRKIENKGRNNRRIQFQLAD